MLTGLIAPTGGEAASSSGAGCPRLSRASASASSPRTPYVCTPYLDPARVRGAVGPSSRACGSARLLPAPILVLAQANIALRRRSPGAPPLQGGLLQRAGLPPPRWSPIWRCSSSTSRWPGGLDPVGRKEVRDLHLRRARPGPDHLLLHPHPPATSRPCADRVAILTRGPGGGERRLHKLLRDEVTVAPKVALAAASDALPLRRASPSRAESSSAGPTWCSSRIDGEGPGGRRCSSRRSPPPALRVTEVSLQRGDAWKISYPRTPSPTALSHHGGARRPRPPPPHRAAFGGGAAG